MKVGISFLLQNIAKGYTDGEVVRREVELAVLAEELGFDFVNYPEHHFDDYSMMVDNTMMLAHVAARTSRIELMLGVIVLPWNDPLRVAEKIILLDHLSNGRVQVGFGRGMSPLEYAAFQIDMNTARERFDEAAPMVINAIETGFIEGNGPFYPQPRVELRPRPSRSFRDRLTSVAMSPGSAVAAAQIRARMMSFIAQPFEKHVEFFEAYREHYRKVHGEEPPPPVFNDKTFCHPDGDYAREIFMEYFTKGYEIERAHYALDSDLFTKGQIKGYESYQAPLKQAADMSIQDAAQARANDLAWGTPDAIVEKISERVKLLGTDITCLFSPTLGPLPYDLIEESMRNLSAHVLPRLREM